MLRLDIRLNHIRLSRTYAAIRFHYGGTLGRPAKGSVADIRGHSKQSRSSTANDANADIRGNRHNSLIIGEEDSVADIRGGQGGVDSTTEDCHLSSNETGKQAYGLAIIKEPKVESGRD